MTDHTPDAERPVHPYRPPLSAFTLTFHSRELSEAYEKFSTMRSLTYVRHALSLAIVLYVAFSWLDPLITPEAAGEIMVIRILNILIFVAVIYLTYTGWGFLHFQFMNGTLVIVSGFGIIGMILVSESTGGSHYYAGLILTVMYAHGLLRLRFIHATVATWSIILLYTTATLFIGITPARILVNNLFFLVSANIMGMFASYWLEYYMKAAFWQTHRLKLKSRELAEEHARKSQELELARQLQLNLLPNSSPRIPGYECSFSMSTATEIGGDFYDYRYGEDRILTFAIGDATGHGAQAGFIVTATKMLFNDLACRMDLIEFLGSASRSLRQLGFRKLYMAFAIGKMKDNEIEIAGAGIPPALVYRSESQTVEQISLNGLPLGSSVEYPYRKHLFMLNPGDCLLLMTDGFPELRNREGMMYGYQNTAVLFQQIADRSSDEILKRMNQEAAEWMGNASLEDDTTFLIIRRKAVLQSGKRRPTTVQRQLQAEGVVEL